VHAPTPGVSRSSGKSSGPRSAAAASAPWWRRANTSLGREVAELLRRQLEDVRADRDAWREQARAGQRLLAPADRKPGWRRIVG
jgi:hypothetical protein